MTRNLLFVGVLCLLCVAASAHITSKSARRSRFLARSLINGVGTAGDKVQHFMARSTWSQAILPSAVVETFEAGARRYENHVARTTDVSLPFTTFVETSAERNARIAARFNSDNGKRWMSADLPRWGYVSSVQEAEETEEHESYAIGIGIQAAYGVLLAIICLIWALVFCCCRCCSKCCCKKALDIDRNLMKPKTLAIVIMVFSAIATAFAIVGLFYSEELSKDLVGDNGTTKQATLLLDEFIDFGSQIKAPINVVASQASTLVTNAQNTLVQPVVGTITNGIAGIVSRLEAQKLAMDGRTFGPFQGVTYTCNPCQTSTTDLQNAIDEINANTGDVISTMSDIVSTFENDLNTQVNEITNEMTKLIVDIDEVQGQIEAAKSEQEPYQEDAEQYDDWRRIGMLVLLSVPLTFVVFGVLGCALAKGYWYSIMYILGFVMVFFTWILFAIHMPTAVVVGDSCLYSNIQERNLTDTFENDTEVLRVIDACIDGTPIIDAYPEAKAELDFEKRLNFSADLFNTDFLDFNEYDNFTNTILAMGLKELVGFDSSSFGPWIAAINNMTSTYGDTNSYGQNNITTSVPAIPGCCPTLPPGSETTKLTDFRDQLAQLIEAFVPLDTFLTDLKTNLTDINAFVGAVKSNLTQAQNNLQNLEQLLFPLTNAVKNVEALRCGFIANRYEVSKKKFCEDVLDDITWISLSLFTVSLVMMGLICCSTRMSKKMSDHDEAKQIMDDVELDAVNGGGYDDQYIQKPVDDFSSQQGPYKGEPDLPPMPNNPPRYSATDDNTRF